MTNIEKIKKSKKRFRKILVISYIAFATLILSSIYMLHVRISSQESLKHFKNNTMQDSLQKQRYLNNFLSRSSNSIKAISENKEFILFVKGDKNKKIAEDLLYSMIKIDKNYMQLRYINANGNEIIRFDRKNIGSKVFKQKNLQNKSRRYYCKKCSLLRKNEIWFSNIDLNVEHGKIEKPIKPVIRVSIPIFNKDEYLGFLIYFNKKQPTSNILIRKAINYGFDRKKMIAFLRNGIGTPALNGFVPKGLPSFNNQKGYDYQPALARKLIAQYKAESGDENPQITITTNAQYLDLCEFIQQEMSNLGLKVKVEVVPPSMLRQAKSKGELPLFRASWIADYPDAENYLSLFYSKFKTPNGSNYTHFSNAVFDKLYEQAIATVDNKKRYKLYQKMDSIVIANAPVVNLYYDEVTMFSQKNVKGFTINPINLLNLKRVRKIANEYTE